jgi:hypothetical protein
MPRLANPVDSAYSGRASVRCLHPSPAKMLGGDRRRSMNLGFSLLVKARTQVLPAHPRTKTNLLLSAERSRPWSLERQSREGCRGPLSFDPARPFRLIPFPAAPPDSCCSSRIASNNCPIYVSYACVMSWFTHILLSLSTCRHIVCPFPHIPFIPAHSESFHTSIAFICYYLLLSSITALNSILFPLSFAQ